MTETFPDLMPEEFRYSRNADGSPAMRCGLLLSERQADALLNWHTQREAKLRKGGWKDWNEGDMALRTICIQVQAYHQRAFKAPRQRPAARRNVSTPHPRAATRENRPSACFNGTPAAQSGVASQEQP